MSQDYYCALGLNKSASVGDVTAAFRKLALKHHPDRNPDDQVAAQQKLDEICEAYDVLSNPVHRVVFDTHGRRGLISGVADGRGGTVKGTGIYKYGMNGDSNSIFMRVFGTGNPFEELYQVSGEFFDPDFKEPVPLIIKQSVDCTLEEFCLGAIKLVEVSIPGCGVFDVRVDVKPGWTDGTELHMSAREIATDSCPKEHYTSKCIFTMRQTPHNLFTREADNLVHVHSLPLVHALTGSVLSIDSLDGQKLTVGVDQVITPQTEHVVPGQGMPRASDPTTRGDLIVRFKTVYPQQLSSDQKHLIKAALYLQAEDQLDEPQQAALRSMRCAFQFN